ncbi:MAG: thiamine diphosphokinase [Pseudomonadota bacterium]
MAQLTVHAPRGATLLGGGELAPQDLAEALTHAPDLVAADSGAAAALAAGLMPRAVIGDMDSLTLADQARLAPGILHHVPEQDSTDFDKVMARIDAPFALGVGFLGARVDHQLAGMNTLVRNAHLPCLLVGAFDIIFVAPREATIALSEGTRVSLFPLAPISGRSEGLHWPIEGLAMTPAGQHGTSNRVAAGQSAIRLSVDAPGLLVILPRAALAAALRALRDAPPWPSPAP